VHERIAATMEADLGGRERRASTIALHFAASGDHERGWKYAVAAGDQAKASYANADAAASYQLALTQVSHLRGVDRTAIARVEESLGDVFDLAGRFEDASAAYARARRRTRSARLLRKSGLMYERTGEYDNALLWYGRARAELRRAVSADQVAQRALVLADMAGARYRQGRLHDALDLGIKAAIDAQAADDAGVLGRATFLLELVTSELGFVGKSVELFRAAGDLNGEADAHNNRGIAAYYRGDWSVALDEYEASRELFARTGDVVGAATALNNIGEILSDQGRLAEAAESYAGAEEGFRKAAYPIGIAVTTSNRARVEARAGNHDQALELYADALAAFEAVAAGAYVVEQLWRRLECLLLAGRTAAARGLEAELVSRLAAATPDAHTSTTVFRLRGWLALLEGDLDGADAHVTASLQAADKAGAAYERALSLLVHAEVQRRRGESGADAGRAAGELLDALGVEQVAGWI
jgi:tetratricopeptide (TPR) repeat protein